MVALSEIFLICLLLIFILMHIAIILKWIPYTFVWGGRLTSDKDMYRFEIPSTIVLIFFLWVAFDRVLNTPHFLTEQTSNILFWLMAILFSLSAIGNILSNHKFEKLVFAPLAFLLAVCCFIVVI